MDYENHNTSNRFRFILSGSDEGIDFGATQVDKEVIFIDIAHDIPPQDIRAGAFALLSSVRFFQQGTIHLAVVDPGVGTERLGIVVESGGHLFVGPNNGLLIPAAKSLGKLKVFKITYQLETSSTFHGRDVICAVD